MPPVPKKLSGGDGAVTLHRLGCAVPFETSLFLALWSDCVQLFPSTHPADVSPSLVRRRSG